MEKEKKQRGSLFTIIGVVLCAAFISIIIINLVLIFSSYLRPDELPGAFGMKPAVVLSDSMEPNIKTGDLILIWDTDIASLKEGDVICYLSSKKAVTHRIKEITAAEDGTTQFITQGDANNTADITPVKKDQIQGVWKGDRVGGLGSFILFMQTPIGMVIFIFCPILLFIIWDVWRRRRMDRAQQSRAVALEAEFAALKNAMEEEPAEKNL